MDNKEIKKLQDGLCTAFIDCMYNSNLAYRPEFISNDHKKGKKVLASIEQELSNCDEFCISVAFITKSGITPLLQILEELERKRYQGKYLRQIISCSVSRGRLKSLSHYIILSLKCSAQIQKSVVFIPKDIFSEKKKYTALLLEVPI